MDVRDAMFWADEAKRKRLFRRGEAYNSAFFPHLEPDVRRREIESLELAMNEIDMADEIADVERDNAERIAAANERKKTMKRTRPRRKRPPKSSKIRSI